jgi:hypothetical protein
MRPIGITEWKFGDAAPGWGFKTQTIVNNLRVRRARRVSRALAILSRRDRHLLAETAQAAMAALDVRGYATMDARMDDMGRVSVLEVNSNRFVVGQLDLEQWSFDRNIKRIVDAARAGREIEPSRPPCKLAIIGPDYRRTPPPRIGEDKAMIRDPRLLVLPLLFLLLLGCAGSVSDTPSADAPSRKPPPFNRTVSWYDDYTLSAKACWRTNSQPPNCP